MSLVKKAVLSVVGKALFRAGTVVQVEEVTPSFLRVAVQGEALQGVHWTPGDKVQVDVGGLELRTYTPLAWDPVRGRTELLVYLHTPHTPAGRWAQGLAEGLPLRLFGPRRSLDVGGAPGGVVLLGDETSFGLARALTPASVVGGQPPQLVFEVASTSEARAVLERLGLMGARLVQRKSGGAHLGALEQALREAATALPGATLALSGRAGTLQQLRARLRTVPLASPPSAMKSKPYWADGKAGLD